MGEAAREMGMQYLGITDHSRTAYYAGGLQIPEVLRQHKEIDQLNAEWDDFKILKGIESDILTDGSLDYPQDILDQFDFIIASVHSQFNLAEEAMTERIIKAIEHPSTTMIGHVTGRLLLSREAYPLNVYKIIDAAVANNVIIEINANPHRLDLDWRVLNYAKEKGLIVSVNPDAHSTQGLADITYGVGVARKGGLGPEDVFNTKPLKAVLTALDCTTT
jgi:DNA polymerase (family 10)